MTFKYTKNHSFFRSMEDYRIKSDIKPRKVDMMRSQTVIDTPTIEVARKIYIPNGNGFVK